MCASNDKNAKRLKPSIVYIKDLHIGNPKDDIWTLNLQSLLNVKFQIYNETVKDIIGEFDLNSFNKLSLTATVNNSDSIESQSNNLSNLIVLHNDEFDKDIKHNKSNSCAKLPQAIHPSNTCNSPKKDNMIKSLVKYAIYGKSSNGNGSNLLAALSPKKRNPIMTNSNTVKSAFKLNDPENDSTGMKTKSASIRICPTSNAELLDFEMVNLDKDEILEDDSFCDAFYIVGLGKSSKIINESEDFKGACNHKSCKILPALEPQLLQVYQGNSSLKISPLVIYFNISSQTYVSQQGLNFVFLY
jgi:hypothetical protein